MTPTASETLLDDPASGRRGRCVAFRHLSVHVPARLEGRMEGCRCGAPPGDRVLSDPGLVEGRENELPQRRVDGVCAGTSGGQDRDAQGLDLLL